MTSMSKINEITFFTDRTKFIGIAPVNSMRLKKYCQVNYNKLNFDLSDLSIFSEDRNYSLFFVLLFKQKLNKNKLSIRISQMPIFINHLFN